MFEKSEYISDKCRKEIKKFASTIMLYITNSNSRIFLIIWNYLFYIKDTENNCTMSVYKHLHRFCLVEHFSALFSEKVASHAFINKKNKNSSLAKFVIFMLSSDIYS